MTDEKQVVSWRQLHIPEIEMPLGGLVTLQKRGWCDELHNNIWFASVYVSTHCPCDLV